jgi:hypothetical protein
VFYCPSKFGDSFFSVPMLKAVPDAVVQVSFQYYLPHLVQGTLGGVNLHQNIFTGNVLIYHFVYRGKLPDYFFHPAVQIFRVHTLAQWDLPSF